MPVPDWIAWPASVVAAVGGVLTIVFNLRRESTSVRFAFEAGEATYHDELGDTFYTPGLEVTVTGSGKKIAL